MKLIISRWLPVCFFLILSTSLFSANRYWIASSAGNWSNTSNWSSTSGGSGGASVPSVNDEVHFDGNGLANCTVNQSVTVAALNITVAYTGILDLNANTFNVLGTDDNFLFGGTISNTLNTSTLIINTTGTTLFSGTTFNTPLDVTSGRLLFDGSLFLIASTFTKTGSLNDNGNGGNTFMQNMVFNNNSSGHFLLGNGNPDTFNGNVSLNNNGTSDLYFAHDGTGHTVNGQLSIHNSGSGNRARIFVATKPNSSLTVIGNTRVEQQGNADTLKSVLGFHGDISFNGKLNLINAGTGLTSEVILGVVNSSQIAISDSTIVLNDNGANLTNRVFLGHQGDITFNGPLAITNAAGSLNAEVFLNHTANSTNLYNENIILSSSNPNTGGIRFGQATGTGILANGKTVSISPTGFNGGTLHFQNFTQLGNTAQTLQTSGNTLLKLIDTQWNGQIDFKSPQISLQGNTFSTTTFLEKTGAIDNTSPGGNTFNGNTTIRNSSNSGFFVPANTLANDFNATVFYHQSGTGLLLPGINCSNTYAGNIIINSSSGLTFGAGSNGRSIMDGSGLQFISLIAGTSDPKFNRLQVNKPVGDVMLFTPITILNELDLDNGHIISSAISLLTIADNGIVSSAGIASFVDGPIRKIGNDAFTFPVGKNGNAFAPIAISAPVNTGDHFTAEYFQVNPDNALPVAFSRASKDLSLDHVSGCEYWILDRTGGSSNVEVILSWDTRSCGVSNLNELRVARWDGTAWRDHGNGATTGSTSTGTITSAGPVSNFSPFTLASVSLENPLPVEFIDFSAELMDKTVFLDWTTLSEINNKQFDIERSIDLENWHTITTIPGKGNSSDVIQYQAKDYSPLKGKSYYRLKQLDYSGIAAYSPIEAISFDQFAIQAYPNPFYTNITLKGLLKEPQYELINMSGEVVVKGKGINLKTNQLTPGAYYLRLRDDSGQLLYSKKLIKLD